MQEISFNDIDGLNAAAGEEWGPWGPEYEMTQERINDFADLTGDHQWIHVDIERANAGPFGGPIAHGFFTLSLVPMLSAMLDEDGMRISGAKNAVNYGGDRLRFLAPVPAGSTVHARSRISEAREHKHGTLVATQIAIHVKGTDVPSVVYDSLTLYQG